MHKELIVLKAVIAADYKRHVKKFSKYEEGKEIAIIGDSMVGYFPMKKLKMEDKYYNLGIPGDTTQGVLDRIEQLIRLKPKKVFVHIGLNDFMLTELETDDIYANIMNICQIIEDQVKDVDIHIINMTPINISRFSHHLFTRYRKLDDTDLLNVKLLEQKRYKVIDLYKLLVDENKELTYELTRDGIHLNEDGYKIYLKAIETPFN